MRHLDLVVLAGLALLRPAWTIRFWQAWIFLGVFFAVALGSW
jgi:hypothetical protein